MTDETGGDGTVSNEGAAPEAEQKARSMGWVPKDDFRGDEAKWVDADTFVKRGEEMLPLLKHHNKALLGKVGSLEGEVGRLSGLLTASQEAIEELKILSTETTKLNAERIRRELVDRIKQAREDNDVDTEVQLTTELGHVSTAITASAEAKPKGAESPPPERPDFTKTEWWKGWVNDNSWFGADKRRTAVAVAIASEMRQDPQYQELRGRDFLDAVKGELDKTLGGSSGGRRQSKVDGGTGSFRSSNGKSYGDLPVDAKEACDKQGRRLVGEGRAFKTQEDWRKHYTQMYFAE